MASFGFGNNSGAVESPKAGPSPSPSPRSGSNNVKETIRTLSAIPHAQEEIPFILTNENGSPLEATKTPSKGAISLRTNEEFILVTPVSLAQDEQIIVSVGTYEIPILRDGVVKVTGIPQRQLGITVEGSNSLESWQMTGATLALITQDHTIKVTNASSVTIGDVRLPTSTNGTIKIAKAIKTPMAVLANWGTPVVVPTGFLNVRAAQAAQAAAQPQRIAVSARRSRGRRHRHRKNRKASRKMR